MIYDFIIPLHVLVELKSSYSSSLLAFSFMYLKIATRAITMPIIPTIKGSTIQASDKLDVIIGSHLDVEETN